MRFSRGWGFTAACLMIQGLLLIISSCAEVATPQGGPKDSDPPILLDADPPNESVLVQPKEVVLRFDEFFEVKDAFNQVLLSPPMSEQPKLVTKGKELYITFPDSFLSNKTYTLQFGDALIDQNEGNILKNFQYVFSTGPVLDSLTLEGQLVDRLTGDPDKDMLVMLYPDMKPELITSGRPYYFARSDAAGKFRLNNLQAGQYRLFALADQNFNYQYDLPNEKIGFVDSLVRADTSSSRYTVYTFTEKSGNGQMSKARSVRYGKIELLFNGNADSSSLRIADNQEAVWEWNNNFDSLQLWIADLNLDSIRIFQQSDSLEESRLVLLKTANKDSLIASTKLGLQPSFPQPLGGKKPETPLPAQVVSFDLGKTLSFRLANPGDIFDTAQIFVINETSGDTLPVVVTWANSQKTLLATQVGWKAEQRYRIELKAGFVKDWYGLTSDSATYLLQLKAQKDYGKISFQLTLPDSAAFVFNLLDATGKVIRSQSIANERQYKLDFDYLLPGNYRARLILDENRNGVWDPGNFVEGKMPESVTYYKESMALRADWQLEFNWEYNNTQIPN